MKYSFEEIKTAYIEHGIYSEDTFPHYEPILFTKENIVMKLDLNRQEYGLDKFFELFDEPTMKSILIDVIHQFGADD